jgi:hypothetical protein
MKRIER